MGKLSAAALVPLLRRFFKYLRPDGHVLVLNMMLGLLITLTGALMIWLVGSAINTLKVQGITEAPRLLLIFGALLVTLQGLRYLSHFLFEWLQQRMIYAIRRDSYEKLLALSVPYRDAHETGDTLSRLGQDITRVSELLILTPGHLVSHGLTLLLYMLILFYIDYRLTLLALVFAPLFLLHQRFFSNKIRYRARAFLEGQGRMGGFEEESLANLEGINTFALEPRMLRRFDEIFTGFRRAAMRNLMTNNLFVVTFELLAGLAAVVLIAMGFFNISKGLLTIGGLVNFLLYLGYLALPLRALAAVPVEAQLKASAAERVAAILDAPLPVCEVPNARALSAAGGIRFEGVGFAYPNGETLFKNFTLNISPGEFIAVLGPSGAGKTTLARLLQRFHDVGDGAILIDDQDVRKVSLHSLRQAIAVVSQEPFILDDSVYENLRLANVDATPAQLRAALKEAGALGFVDALPERADTRLGTRGARLSVGQRQRIAIARALLKHAPIIIFDEATSALDSQSEAAVKKSIGRLRETATLIVIAHRYSTILDADRLVYLYGDGDYIVGTHELLLEHCAAYRRTLINQGYYEQSAHSVY